MSEVIFFVESKKSDAKFLIDFIEERFSITFSMNDFIELGSWSGYKKEAKKYTELYTDKIQITFLDADDNFGTRKQTVKDDFTELGIKSQLFLFPNNTDNGELENILERVAVDRKIIECFEGYEKCIEGYEKPVIKSKIFAYLDALLEKKNKKNNRKDLYHPENRNYRNKEHWKLDHKYLDTLHTFLTPFLIPNP